ncbi:nitrate reductase molybdenum cofactor assembly chaperone [Streptomyces nitrosporeus]|uniref:Nitrate reductase molybdenum cofactor assembly chaperone n=1 Tax=Streptomyces nitrosporeus TaxID=28894 RepID=A0A5J6FK36_9ACTN|nr:nitrate reductase molybdenum cofactor assembly chaperone [Streptomyces nitrosporeus]QEU75704.1 nitrate reductase molybdenum cofactor assembly chaperone [Streptomyces nitrosporeus]GGY87385.1 nitrate reductase molybdenum cofactor assembly chaperone [Streptomyces nitrosporeus]
MTVHPARISPAAARRRPSGPEAAAERARHLRLLSLLFQYPDAELTAARLALAGAARSLPPSRAAAELRTFTTWFAGRTAEELETHYVEVFDLRRSSSLYLTYYLHGDTRRRGAALLTLSRTYRAAGWECAAGELPDHLPVALEFAALAGPRTGEAPLRRHRRGLELIHHALDGIGSPYRHLMASLLALLPPATAAEREAVARLAAEGPPVEDVGRDTYDGGGFAPPDAFVPPGPADLPGPPGQAGPLVPPGRTGGPVPPSRGPAAGAEAHR